jgi:microsomal dipeptidase-like Zn-dependent dipeptidase
VSALVLNILLSAAGAALVLAGITWLVAPSVVGRHLNGVARPFRAPLSERARTLHRSLDVVDLHADALLWRRDLLRRGRWGHLDVPRLIEGRVAVQAFTVVTRVPRGANIESNRDDSDLIGWLALVQGWPRATRGSVLQRALFQAHRLHETAGRSAGALTVIETRSDLVAHLERRRAGGTGTAGFLGMEGAHALEGELGNVDLAYEAGFRLIGLTHFTDNEVGGSAHGARRGGLTGFGTRVVARMESLGMLVDLAHACPELIDDVLAVATRPVVVSHTGVRATCDNRRNLDDLRLRAVADGGGLVGLGLWDTAVCGDRPSDWARAVRHAAGVAGVEHVALGSDWDGAVRSMLDAAGTVHLTAALLDEGFGEDDIRRIMGGNAIRLLLETLPEDDGES